MSGRFLGSATGQTRTPLIGCQQSESCSLWPNDQYFLANASRIVEDRILPHIWRPALLMEAPQVLVLSMRVARRHVRQYTILDDPGGVGEKYWSFGQSGNNSRIVDNLSRAFSSWPVALQEST